MDAEVRKIENDLEEENVRELWDMRNRDAEKKNLCLSLNENMYAFHTPYGRDKMNYQLDDYVEKIVQNIYIILKLFARLNIYPEGFFEIIKERKEKQINNREDNIVDFYKKIDREFSYLKSKKSPSLLEDIGVTYDKLVQFYQKNNLAYNNPDKINDLKYMDDLCIKNGFITEKIMITDSFDEDIENLMNLMFIYMSFLVDVGINPKDKLSEIIEENKNNKKTR